MKTFITVLQNKSDTYRSADIPQNTAPFSLVKFPIPGTEESHRLYSESLDQNRRQGVSNLQCPPHYSLRSLVESCFLTGEPREQRQGSKSGRGILTPQRRPGDGIPQPWAWVSSHARVACCKSRSRTRRHAKVPGYCVCLVRADFDRMAIRE